MGPLSRNQIRDMYTRPTPRLLAALTLCVQSSLLAAGAGLLSSVTCIKVEPTHIAPRQPVEVACVFSPSLAAQIVDLRLRTSPPTWEQRVLPQLDRHSGQFRCTIDGDYLKLEGVFELVLYARIRPSGGQTAAGTLTLGTVAIEPSAGATYTPDGFAADLAKARRAVKQAMARRSLRRR